MKDFVFVTDSNADFPPGYGEKNGIRQLDLSYTLDDVSYHGSDPRMSEQAFYNAMRSGKMPKTSAVNVQEAKSLLTDIAREGKDALCIHFSGTLSATCQNVETAAAEVREMFPQRKILVVDSKSASSGQGLLIDLALEYAKEGHTVEEVEAKVQQDIQHLRHTFTVDDLNHLRRGGRVSATTALVGTALGIKPLLYVTPDGRLVPFGKVRGRKAALKALAEDMEKNFDPVRCDRFFISHGDCAEDVQTVVEEIKRRTGVKRYEQAYVGPIIGAHAGPGTVALFYYGKPRPQPK